MDDAFDAVVEIFSWVGIGLGALLAGVALVIYLFDGTWLPVRAVVEESEHGRLVRWFDEDGQVNEAHLSHDQAHALAGKDMADIFYRRGETEMPAFLFEYGHAKVEGVRFHWMAQPVAIVERDGHAAAVRFLSTQLGAPDSKGRRVPEAIPGSEFEVACDLVIPALGQSRLTAMLPVEVEGGVIKTDRATGRTGNPKYYAGGDCVNGGREVVDAVADGKRAALGMVNVGQASRPVHSQTLDHNHG